MKQLVIGIVVSLAAAVGRAGDAKGPSKEAVAKAEKVVQEHLERIKGAYGQTIHLEEPALRTCFPEDLFLAVRYRQFPVARQLPEGMRASNIFVVRKDGKLLHLKDTRTLQVFFKDSGAAVKDAGGAGATLASWLTLAQEFHQDGFFKFELNKGNFSIEKSGAELKAIGRAIVMQGGNGEINATLQFEDGKLAKVAQSAKVIPGPRPICQATKLLDPDPIVRRMAENDLLYLGDLVRGYLDEQRAQATAELREAIDRVWRRIEKQQR